jgi:transposase
MFRWTFADIDEMRRDAPHTSVAELAQHFEIHERTMRRLLKLHGIPYSLEWTPELVAELRCMKAEGMTQGEMAFELGATRRQVQRMLKKLGFPLRQGARGDLRHKSPKCATQKRHTPAEIDRMMLLASRHR